MESLVVWLQGLGLGRYASVLAENEVDFEVLRLLSEPDLQELGLPLGPRKKLLKASGCTGWLAGHLTTKTWANRH